MITYTYNIGAITKKTVNGVENTIFEDVWKKVGCDENGNKGDFRICSHFDTSEVGISTSFVPYENLTKETIVGWIESITDEQSINGIIAEGIQKSIDNQVQVYQFPWTVVENPPQENNEEVVTDTVDSTTTITPIYHDYFWESLIEHPIYQTIKTQASQSLSVNVAYTQFITSILEAKADRPNHESVQLSINELINSLSLTDSEYNSLETLLEIGNMNTVYTLPQR